MDDVLRRLERAINWLIFQEVAENETELAEKLGYRKSGAVLNHLSICRVPKSDYVNRNRIASKMRKKRDF